LRILSATRRCSSSLDICWASKSAAQLIFSIENWQEVCRKRRKRRLPLANYIEWKREPLPVSTVAQFYRTTNKSRVDHQNIIAPCSVLPILLLRAPGSGFSCSVLRAPESPAPCSGLRILLLRAPGSRFSYSVLRILLLRAPCSVPVEPETVQFSSELYCQAWNWLEDLNMPRVSDLQRFMGQSQVLAMAGGESIMS
jgi:hypothetical protein